MWVTNNPMKAKMLALKMVIGNLTKQLDSKGTTKQFNKYFGNSNPSTVASGNNEKYDAPKPGEPFTKMSGKQLKTYCGKCSKGKVYGVGMNRRTTMIITFQNNETTHANMQTAEIRNFNSTMT